MQRGNKHSKMLRVNVGVFGFPLKLTIGVSFLVFSLVYWGVKHWNTPSGLHVGHVCMPGFGLECVYTCLCLFIHVHSAYTHALAGP